MASHQRGGQFVAVILAGGFGTRLWPLSREDRPKQFLPLAGERSLFQQTIDRLLGPGRPHGLSRIVVVGGAGHGDLIASQCDQPGLTFDVLYEPVARNTAAAIAAAIAHVQTVAPGAMMAVLAADHHIADSAAFLADLAKARDAAANGSIVTFGIKPEYPHTGYGYIRFHKEDGAVARICGFEEKPDLATAKAWLESGDCYWNSGMFVFAADAIEAEYEALAPDIAKGARLALMRAQKLPGGLLLDAQAFGLCPALPFDKAIMERTTKGMVVRASFPWSDLGAWPSIHAVAAQDASGNSVAADDWLVDASNVFRTGGSRKLAAIGVSNLVIIETGDVLLVADAARSQDLRQFVERARSEEPELARHSDTPQGLLALARRNGEGAKALLAEYPVLQQPPGFPEPGFSDSGGANYSAHEIRSGEEAAPAGSPSALLHANKLLKLYRQSGITAIRQQALEIARRFAAEGFDREEWQPGDWPQATLMEGRYGWALCLAVLGKLEPQLNKIARKLLLAAEGELQSADAGSRAYNATLTVLRVKALSALQGHGSAQLEAAVASLLQAMQDTQLEGGLEALALYVQGKAQ